MPHEFAKNWERDTREPLVSRIGSALHRGTPLKERVAHSIYRLKAQSNRLDGAAMRMQRHDKELFSKCIAAQMNRDSARAAMYANECAEIRKMAKVTLRCQLALEQVGLRLETVEEFGDVAANMGPVASVVHAIKNQISGIMPQVSFELGEIGEVLNGIVIEAGNVTGEGFDYETSSEEAQRIMGEANAIAEQRMREKFPDLPTAIPSAEKPVESSPFRATNE